MFAYYIYFRVDLQHASQLASKIKAMQAKLLAETGIKGRLLIKEEEPLLWMEVYEQVKDRLFFERCLSEAVALFEIANFLQANSSRKLECFSEHV